MSRVWRHWLGLLAGEESGEPLAAFRILTALAVLWALVGTWHAGVLDLMWVPPADGGYQSVRGEGPLAWLLGPPSGPTVRALVAVASVAAALLAVGILPRASALVAGQCFMTVTGCDPDARGSYDALLQNALWILVFARSAQTWSLEARLASGSWRRSGPVPAWPRRIAVFQLAVVYGSSALHKISAAWFPAGGYSALYYVFQQPAWQRFDLTHVAAAAYPLTQVLTAVTWLFEATWPLLLLWSWVRHVADTRRPPRSVAWLLRWDPRLAYVLCGVALHLGILAVLEVGPFSLGMLAFYPCLFRGRRPAG
jgi:hypothetical protein